MERKNGEETEGKAATLLLPFLKIFIFPLQSPEERSAAEGAGKAGDHRAGNTPPVGGPRAAGQAFTMQEAVKHLQQPQAKVSTSGRQLRDPTELQRQHGATVQTCWLRFTHSSGTNAEVKERGKLGKNGESNCDKLLVIYSFSEPIGEEKTRRAETL